MIDLILTRDGAGVLGGEHECPICETTHEPTGMNRRLGMDIFDRPDPHAKEPTPVGFDIDEDWSIISFDYDVDAMFDSFNLTRLNLSEYLQGCVAGRVQEPLSAAHVEALRRYYEYDQKNITLKVLGDVLAVLVQWCAAYPEGIWEIDGE